MFTAFILLNYKWDLDISKVKKRELYFFSIAFCSLEMYFTKFTDHDLQLNQVVIVEP